MHNNNNTVIVLKDSWRLEADLMHVGTAMSVELDTTHQGCCCEPLNLAQRISLTPSPHAFGPLPFSLHATLKVGTKGKLLVHV